MYDRAVRTKSDIPLACNSCCLKEMCHTGVFEDTNELRGCYEESKFGSDCDPVGLLNQKGLYFIHVSAMSLLPKLDELELLMSSCKTAAIAVSETGWTLPSMIMKLDFDLITSTGVMVWS